MSLMPTYSRFRPDFMAPGPYVEILDEKPPSFDDAHTTPISRGDDDDDFTSFEYYPSDKILGRLFRSIDERKIFEEVQKYRDGINRVQQATSPVLDGIWKYILQHCASIPWQHHLDLARGIRDEYVHILFCPLLLSCENSRCILNALCYKCILTICGHTVMKRTSSTS
jgi:hypothetical protein